MCRRPLHHRYVNTGFVQSRADVVRRVVGADDHNLLTDVVIGAGMLGRVVLHALEDVAAGEGWHIRLCRHTRCKHKLLRAKNDLLAIAIDEITILLVIVGAIGVMVASRRPQIARFVAPPYAIVEGLFVGAVSHAYETWQNGIVLAAVGSTVGVFAVMLVLYRFRIIKVTERFRAVVMSATMGLMAFYLVSLLLHAFGVNISIINSASGLGIAFSVLAAGLAAFNLLLDFDLVERGTRSGAPAYMNWFAALGLLVTIVWLYLEMLRLLSKLQRR